MLRLSIYHLAISNLYLKLMKFCTEIPSQSIDAVGPPLQPTVTPVKRGPGRPRLKPNGPGNQGHRGPPRLRKPIGPLVVPLGSSPAPTPPGRSPAMSPAPSPAPVTSHDRNNLGFYQPAEDEIYIKPEVFVKQEMQ